MIRSIVIVGAGLAGASAAERLRQLGYDGRLVLVGDEPWQPYQRPPLSKEFLWPGAAESAISLRDSEWYEAQRIELRTGIRALGLRRAEREVLLSDGTALAAGRILVATGARPRRIPALRGAANVHYLRTRDDAEAIAARIRAGTRLVILGMGAIGAEVAATATRAGVEVSVVEAGPAPMHRSLGSLVGSWLARKHSELGVRMCINRRAVEYRHDGRHISAVILDDGRPLQCDALVVGIGVEPVAELGREAGLATADGIVVGRDFATSHPQVFAAGDVASLPGYFGGRVRMETFHNAAAQGALAAEAMLGGSVDGRQPCSFWTDQFEFRIQACGRVGDELDVVIRGEIEGDEFTLFYLDQGRLVGAVAVNRPADMVVAKRMILERQAFDRAALADPATSLRALVAKRA